MKILVVVLLLAGCSGSKFDSGPKPFCDVLKGTVPGEQIIRCKNSPDIIVKDGKDGEDGETPLLPDFGQDGLIIGYYDPCGDQSNHDEILLLTSDGEYIGYFTSSSDAKDARLTTLKEGPTYTTTDGTNCKFKLVDGEIQDNLI